MAEIFANFHFLRPVWLLALIPVALLTWAARRSGPAGGAVAGLIAPHLLQHLVVTPGDDRRLSPRAILLALLALGSLATAGPAWQRESLPTAEDRAILVVVLEVSESMQGGDLAPSRAERARHKLHDLLALRAGSRTALVAYAGSAHLVMPPTADRRILEQMAAALSPEVLPVAGDTLDAGLAAARSEIERAGDPGSILVIADGVEAARLGALENAAGGVPVQFLAMVSSMPVAERNGLAAAAGRLDAGLRVASADDADVRAIHRDAASATAGGGGEDSRWRDAGYPLLPLIALGMLLWSVRGFSVGWN